MLDIETAPNLAFVWGLFKENIPLQRLVDSGYVLCWAAKWLGEDEVMFDSIHRHTSKTMLKGIHKLLDEADAVVHWNGNSFDIPTLNKEFLLHGIKPPSPAKQIDLLLTSRKRFRFVSNKLDYVAQALGIGSKHSHAGFELWVQCMNKDSEAWAVMEEYNKNDVTLLEGVYEVFLPWIHNHPNVGLYAASEDNTCPNCGSDAVVKRGFSHLSSGKYQRYRCTDCGTWSRNRKSIKLDLKLTIDKA